jgi:hypothetical protein
LKAVAEGFRGLGYRDDHELNAAGHVMADINIEVGGKVAPQRLD